jgi:hypothetical protein
MRDGAEWLQITQTATSVRRTFMRGITLRNLPWDLSCNLIAKLQL